MELLFSGVRVVGERHHSRYCEEVTFKLRLKSKEQLDELREVEHLSGLSQGGRSVGGLARVVENKGSG